MVLFIYYYIEGKIAQIEHFLLCLLQRIDFGKNAVKFESAMSERDTPNHKSKQHKTK